METGMSRVYPICVCSPDVVLHRLGRIKTMIIGSIWVLVGAALQCSAQNIAWYVAIRHVRTQT